MSPAVSVVIACHDEGRELDEAVDSVFAQTRTDFEILVVDDGSTDPATVRLLRGYRWPKTRVLAADHRGAAAARNLALREACGTYVCPLDPSERLERRWLERVTAVLDADATLSFACALARTARDDSSATVRASALVRREAAVAVGGWKEAPLGGGHWGLWLRLVEAGFAGTLVGAVLTQEPSADAASGVALPAPVRRVRPALTPHDRRRLEVESALWNARRDIEDLRNSASWRVTGPARAVHRWLVRLKGGS